MILLSKTTWLGQMWWLTSCSLIAISQQHIWNGLGFFFIINPSWHYCAPQISLQFIKERKRTLLFKEFYSTNLFIFAQWLVIIGNSMLFIHTVICKINSAVKYENKTKLVSKLTKQIKKEICCSIRTNYPDSKLNSFSFLSINILKSTKIVNLIMNVHGI